MIMVIDAAEGVMPQTKEHLDILSCCRLKGPYCDYKIDLVIKNGLNWLPKMFASLEGTFLSASCSFCIIFNGGVLMSSGDLGGLGDCIRQR